MHGEDLLVNDCGNRQAVEAIRESLPQLYVVPSFAFVVKSVDPVNGRTLMIASKDEEVLWVFDFVRQ